MDAATLKEMSYKYHLGNFDFNDNILGTQVIEDYMEFIRLYNKERILQWNIYQNIFSVDRNKYENIDDFILASKNEVYQASDKLAYLIAENLPKFLVDQGFESYEEFSNKVGQLKNKTIARIRKNNETFTTKSKLYSSDKLLKLSQNQMYLSIDLSSANLSVIINYLLHYSNIYDIDALYNTIGLTSGHLVVSKRVRVKLVANAITKTEVSPGSKLPRKLIENLINYNVFQVINIMLDEYQIPTTSFKAVLADEIILEGAEYLDLIRAYIVNEDGFSSIDQFKRTLEMFNPVKIEGFKGCVNITQNMNTKKVVLVPKVVPTKDYGALREHVKGLNVYV